MLLTLLNSWNIHPASADLKSVYTRVGFLIVLTLPILARGVELPNGESVLTEIGVPGEVDTYEFDASPEQVIHISVGDLGRSVIRRFSRSRPSPILTTRT